MSKGMGQPGTFLEVSGMQYGGMKAMERLERWAGKDTRSYAKRLGFVMERDWVLLNEKVP